MREELHRADQRKQAEIELADEAYCRELAKEKAKISEQRDRPWIKKLFPFEITIKKVN
ncbi:MAG: hypothetical protein AAF542_00130 [Pseudomonadota bacterium]